MGTKSGILIKFKKILNKMLNSNADSTGTNDGLRSKFQYRLKQIAKERTKKTKIKYSKEEQDKFINDKVKEIREVMGKEPITKKTYQKKSKNNNIDSEKKKKVINKRKKNINIEEHKLINVLVEKPLKSSKKISTNEKKEQKFNYIQEEYIPSKTKASYISKQKKKEVSTPASKEQIEKLGIELINKLKESFNEKLDQLDVLESELYLLSQEQDNSLEIRKVKELKEKIDQMLKEINDIMLNYKLLEKNYYIDYVIDLEDKYLADDIINYRTLLDNSNAEIDFVEEYKLLDEFVNLYDKLIIIKHETEEILEQNEEKTEEFDIRDKKYANIVDSILKIDVLQKDCLSEIERQNEYLKKLAEKIDIIDKQEYVTTHLRGMGDLISASLKYIGLSMLSPLSGLIPSIAINTLATRHLISNIRKNLHYEDVNHIYYSAVNYESELNHKLFDVNYTINLVDDTLGDIKKLKEEFLKQYNSELPGYKDTLTKINDIEKLIYRNQNKMTVIKKKLIANKKINEYKLVRVKTLNENASNQAQK